MARTVSRLAAVGLMPSGLHAADHLVPVHRLLENPWCAGQLGPQQADPVDLDVVGMAVVAIVVVDGEHVGPLLAQDRGQPLGGLRDVGGPERTGLVVGGFAHHPGVDVAQELRPRPENLGGGEGFGHPAVPQGFAVGQEVVFHLAVFAAGGDHQDHPMSLVGGLAHDATAHDALVVGMGVERHQGGHGRTRYDSVCPGADRSASSHCRSPMRRPVFASNRAVTSTSTDSSVRPQ